MGVGLGLDLSREDDDWFGSAKAGESVTDVCGFGPVMTGSAAFDCTDDGALDGTGVVKGAGVLEVTTSEVGSATGIMSELIATAAGTTTLGRGGGCEVSPDGTAATVALASGCRCRDAVVGPEDAAAGARAATTGSEDVAAWSEDAAAGTGDAAAATTTAGTGDAAAGT